MRFESLCWYCAPGLTVVIEPDVGLWCCYASDKGESAGVFQEMHSIQSVHDY